MNIRNAGGQSSEKEDEPDLKRENEARSDDILSQEPETIAARAAGVGQERLDRSAVDVVVTGFIAGVEVSFGALAAMLVLGITGTAAPSLGLYGGLAWAGLVFPSAFLFVTLGRSELFTENFLIPVVALLEQRRSVRELLELWSASLLGNLAGCAALALLLTVPKAMGEPILHGFAEYSAYKLSLPFPGLLVSAVFAGVLMTVLTWLLLSVQQPVAKILVIWSAGYVLFATNLSHVVVSAAILFVGFSLTNHTLLDVARYLGVATLGNLVGGVGLVTLLRLIQVKEKQRHRGAQRTD